MCYRYQYKRSTKFCAYTRKTMNFTFEKHYNSFWSWNKLYKLFFFFSNLFIIFFLFFGTYIQGYVSIFVWQLCKNSYIHVYYKLIPDYTKWVSYFFK